MEKLAQGAITASWDEFAGRSLTSDEALFTMTFRAKSNAQLSEVLSIASRYTKAEAYSKSSELMDVNLEFNTESGLIEAKQFALYQNQPNPFKDATVISFQLPEATTATLTIYDVSGKLLKVIDGEFAKGYNEINIDRSEISTSGVLYYQLDTPTHTATKKMTIVN